MEAMDKFFIRENRVEGISENDYKKTELIISSLKAYARLTYNSIYVIDYYRKNFLYVSDNPIFLCGYRPDKVKEMGFQFYLNNVPTEELSMLLEINKAGFEFFNKTSVEERLKLFISYDFHISNSYNLTLINHKLTPIVLDGNGNIWLAFCVVSLSSNRESGNIEVHKDGCQEYWIYSMHKHQWEKQSCIRLTNREKEILLLSAQGLSENDIYNKIYISTATIKFHKKSIFNKLCVRNIQSAIIAASNKKLI